MFDWATSSAIRSSSTDRQGEELRGNVIAPDATSLLEEVAILRTYQDLNPKKGRKELWAKHIERAT
jgi:hypothetical protein